MDTDVVLLRPFAYSGDYFFNLQWESNNVGHFICGNVMNAKPHSDHFKTLYEESINNFSNSKRRKFGDIGPRLLSDCVISGMGTELRQWVFSPVFFNSIDWTEVENLNRPFSALADYLNDSRVLGVHLWNSRTYAHSRQEDKSLMALLSSPAGRAELRNCIPRQAPQVSPDQAN